MDTRLGAGKVELPTSGFPEKLPSPNQPMRCKAHPTPIPLCTSQWKKTKPLLLSCYLYGSPKLLIAEAAHECPPTAGDVRHLCDGLHLLRAANAYLESQNSKMGLHGSES